MQGSRQTIGPLIGRIFLGFIFFLAAIGKIVGFEQAAASLSQVLEGPAKLYLAIAILLELCGSLMLFLGYWTRVGAAFLMVFLFLATLLYHRFWLYEGGAQELQVFMFLKNIAIFGGLLMVASFGGGAWSLDGRRARRKT